MEDQEFLNVLVDSSAECQKQIRGLWALLSFTNVGAPPFKMSEQRIDYEFVLGHLLGEKEEYH